MRPKLALLFLFALATICSAPSCSYKTYAQDDDAGIMTLAKGAGKIAYSRLSDLVLAECGQSYYTRETSPTHPAETYVYILKDIEDDATGDVWLFSGCVLTYDTDHLRWVTVGLAASLYAVNSKWALKSTSVSLGLPYMNVGNRYGLTYLEAETYFMVRVQAERKCCELNGSTFDESSYPYVNYINCDVWDTDGGGVNDIAEWVRGTANDDWTDDNPSGNACMCGACCRCKCECRKWDGSTCAGSTGEGGCDCHKDDDPEEECACAKYCCLDKCECKAHPNGGHDKHQNGLTYCNQETDPKSGGCSCHGTTDDEECVCSKYCCLDKCECKAHPNGGHGKHQNGLTYCNQGTDPISVGCSCHEAEKVEFPEDKDYEVPEEERKDSFLPGSDFNYSFLRLKDRIERKFRLVKLSSLLKGDLSGELPCWSFPLPALLGDELEIDLNVLGDYKIFAIIRKVLVFWVYYFTIMTVFNSLRRLL